MDVIDVDEGQLAICTALLDDSIKKLDLARQDFEGARYDDRQKELNIKLREVEENEQQVTQELTRSTKQADTRAKLAVLKKDLDSRQTALESLVAANTAKFNSILGEGWTTESLEKTLTAVIDERDEELQEAVVLKGVSDAEFSRIDVTFSHSSQTIKRKKQELEASRAKVEAAVKQLEWEVDETSELPDQSEWGLKHYTTILEEWEADLKKENSEKGKATVYIDYLQNALTQYDKSQICVTCKRDINTEEAKSFKLLIQRQIDKLRKNISAENIEIIERDLKSLKDVRQAYDTYKRLEAEIPQLQEEHETLNQQREEKLAAADSVSAPDTKHKHQ